MRHLGITHLVAVAGASMGGMQALQWAVSHPGMMDGVVALTPMARTSAWSIAVNEATVHGFQLDPAFKDGDYAEQPMGGWKMRADILNVIATRTPAAMRAQFAEPGDVVDWMGAQETTAQQSGFDANDWIAQVWAYDHHNVGDTSVEGVKTFDGDPLKALRTVRARVLVMSGTLDLYNPVAEGVEAAAAIPDGRHVTIPSTQGHVAASAGFRAADISFINATVRAFMADLNTRPRAK